MAYKSSSLSKFWRCLSQYTYTFHTHSILLSLWKVPYGQLTKEKKFKRGLQRAIHDMILPVNIKQLWQSNLGCPKKTVKNRNPPIGHSFDQYILWSIYQEKEMNWNVDLYKFKGRVKWFGHMFRKLEGRTECQATSSWIFKDVYKWVSWNYPRMWENVYSLWMLIQQPLQ